MIGQKTSLQEQLMTGRTSTTGKKLRLNHLNHQLGLYSLAAAATGVSLLALARPAAGEVVVTHKTIPIPLANSHTPQPVKLSLANNGEDNFFFYLSSGAASANNFPDRELCMEGKAEHAGVIEDGFSTYAFALAPGAPIGKKSTYFKHNFALIEASTSFQAGKRFVGYWAGNPQDRYLGVRFEIDGAIHYGWIRLTVTTTTELHGPYMSAEITEYAYETEPNTIIYAGETEERTPEMQAPSGWRQRRGPSLGMLAAGAEAVPMWRGKD
jgi:hypothetical protein